MRAGRLRHRLWLKKPTHANSTAGTVVTTWGTAAVLWGSIEPLKGQEYYDSAAINSEVTSRIVIRYTSDIEPNYILVFETRTFKILSVIDIDEKNREMQLMVKEEVII